MEQGKTGPKKSTFTVGPDGEGLRLDLFLARSELGLSRTQIKRLIEKGLVKIPGNIRITPSTRLSQGQRIQVTIPEPEPLELVPTRIAFDILFEDKHILVINKPPRLTVHPGAGNREHTLVHGLLFHCKDLSGIGGQLRPGIVHRLDKDTSGVLVVAKNDVSHMELSSQFKHGKVHKAYLALVRGVPKEHSGLIDLPIGRHPIRRKKMAVLDQDKGRVAISRWHVKASFKGAALLVVRIYTGRTHQIRVHLSAIGHPVLGDSLYGGPRRFDAGTKSLVIPRQMLHAARIRFRHPVRHEELVFEAPLPEDMKKVLDFLKNI